MAGLLLAGCATPAPADVASTRAEMQQAWQANQHAIWQIDWPNAPAGGPVTVEIWRNGPRYRFEILESTAPALIGEVLVFDGRQAWRYNRLDPPNAFSPVEPALSPVTELVAHVEQLLAQPATSASRADTFVQSQPSQKFTLDLGNGDSLSLWRLEATGLPVRLEFQTGTQQGRVEVRLAEPLPAPAPQLFEVGPWLR